MMIRSELINVSIAFRPSLTKKRKKRVFYVLVVICF